MLEDHKKEAERERQLRVAAYCRVSTKSDLQDGSFETQMKYYQKYIESHGEMTLVGLYGDHGKSGRFMKKRKELNRLLKDCESGKVDLILCKSVSRFARNLSECISTVRRLKELGTSVFFEKEGLDTGDEKNELLLSILATIAQEESNSIGQNVKWSRQKHYEMGQPIEKPSYAYRRDGDNHDWVVEESEAKRVRLAFYLAGIGTKYPQILAQMNELEKMEGTSKVWHQTPLVNLLTNLAYIGDYLSNKECTIATENGVKRRKNRGYADQYYIEEHHASLVSRELFEGVGELLKRRLLFAKRSFYTHDDLELLERCRKLAEKEREQNA